MSLYPKEEREFYLAKHGQYIMLLKDKYHFSHIKDFILSKLERVQA